MKMRNIDHKEKEALYTQQKLEKEFADYQKKYIQRSVRYKLLMLVDENWEKIELFLKRWQIPEKGHETEKGCRKWWRNLSPKIKLRKRTIFYFEAEHIAHIKNFNKVFVTSTPTEYGKRKKVIIGRNLKYLFISEIEELMADCKIDPFWYYPFEHYLLYNEVNMNFMFNPGFAISIKAITGSGNKILSENITISLSANTRLKDVIRFAMPMVKHYQQQLSDYRDDPDIITSDDEQEYKLGPTHLPKQTTHTWLVSSGSVCSDERINVNKKSSKR